MNLNPNENAVIVVGLLDGARRETSLQKRCKYYIIAYDIFSRKQL